MDVLSKIKSGMHRMPAFAPQLFTMIKTMEAWFTVSRLVPFKYLCLLLQSLDSAFWLVNTQYITLYNCLDDGCVCINCWKNYEELWLQNRVFGFKNALLIKWTRYIAQMKWRFKQSVRIMVKWLNLVFSKSLRFWVKW